MLQRGTVEASSTRGVRRLIQGSVLGQDTAADVVVEVAEKRVGAGGFHGDAGKLRDNKKPESANFARGRVCRGADMRLRDYVKLSGQAQGWE